jgi:hypothetical protein
MGQLIVHQKDGLLELDGFLLQVGDLAEIRIIGSWIPGIIAHDQGGWYLRTRDQDGVRLQTGLFAHLLSLSSEVLPLPTSFRFLRNTMRNILGEEQVSD